MLLIDELNKLLIIGSQNLYFIFH